MARVLFISRRDDRVEYDTAPSMAAKIRAVDSEHVYDAIFLEDLVFSYDGNDLRVMSGSHGQDIKSYDFVFFLGWFISKPLEEAAQAAALYLNFHKVPLINSELLTNRSKSKLTQYLLSAIHGISTPPFLFSLDSANTTQTLASFLSAIGEPLILKNPFASRGHDNYLASTAAEARKILQEHIDTPFIVQSFIPNDGDYRLLVLDSKVSLIIRRQAKGNTHLNNTSQGGTASIEKTEDLPAEILTDAIKIARLLKRQVTGVDVVIHQKTGEHFFLEANNMPQLSTGAFVDEKMKALAGFIDRKIVDQSIEKK